MTNYEADETQLLIDLYERYYYYYRQIYRNFIRFFIGHRYRQTTYFFNEIFRFKEILLLFKESLRSLLPYPYRL